MHCHCSVEYFSLLAENWECLNGKNFIILLVHWLLNTRSNTIWSFVRLAPLLFPLSVSIENHCWLNQQILSGLEWLLCLKTSLWPVSEWQEGFLTRDVIFVSLFQEYWSNLKGNYITLSSFLEYWNVLINTFMLMSYLFITNFCINMSCTLRLRRRCLKQWSC